MHILLTNTFIKNRTGSEVYIYELALALKYKFNASVEVFCLEIGDFAESFKPHNINVTNNIDSLYNYPDIIHLQHTIPARLVLDKFPNSPAIYFCHDRTADVDVPFIHHQIKHYVAVDKNCFDKIIEQNISSDFISIIHNWFGERFILRQHINAKPSKALVFSNYASDNSYVEIIKSACNFLGIKLDIIGLGVNNHSEHPELDLLNYDLVFAKAKAAIESIASGAATIVCDYRGLAEMVTPSNFDYYREFNFGMRLLQRPFDKKLLIEEILKYDANNSLLVSNMIVQKNNIQRQVSLIFELYMAVFSRKNTTCSDMQIEPNQNLVVTQLPHDFYNWSEITHRRQILLKMQYDLEQANSTLTKVYESRSWRSTAFLRKIANFCRMLRNNMSNIE